AATQVGDINSAAASDANMKNPPISSTIQSRCQIRHKLPASERANPDQIAQSACRAPSSVQKTTKGRSASLTERKIFMCASLGYEKPHPLGRVGRLFLLQMGDTCVAGHCAM